MGSETAMAEGNGGRTLSRLVLSITPMKHNSKEPSISSQCAWVSEENGTMTMWSQALMESSDTEQ